MREALKAAIDSLRQAEDVEEPSERDVRDELHLDHDRQGVTGSPRLLETILKKIDASAVFVADVTPVSHIPAVKTPGARRAAKRNMNPNVAIELGYAFKSLTELNVLMVLNEHYGDRTHLPFDIQGNAGPLTYRLAPNAPTEAIKQEQAKLKGQLAAALGEFVRHAAAAAPAIAPAHTSAQAETQRQALRELWWQAVQGRNLNERPVLVSSPSALVHVVPSAALGPVDLDPRDVRSHVNALRLFDDSENASDGRQWWSHGPRTPVPGRPNPEARWYGRLLPSGVVEFECCLGTRIDDDPTIVAKGTRIESQIVDAADHGLEMTRALALRGPYAIGLVLYGLEDLEIAVPGGRMGRFRLPSLDLPLSIAPAEAIRAGDHLRRAFDVMWMAAGFSQSPSYDQPQWKGYAE